MIAVALSKSRAICVGAYNTLRDIAIHAIYYLKGHAPVYYVYWKSSAKTRNHVVLFK